MRFAALVPVLLCSAALVLSFLCLFAGSKKGFMEDYALVTVSLPPAGAPELHLTGDTIAQHLEDWG